MQFKANIFFKEFILFLSTLGLGIFSSYSYASLVSKTSVQPVSFSWASGLVYIVFFVAVSFILFRFKKVARSLMKFFLMLVVFSGSQIIFAVFVPPLWDIMSAIILVLAFVSIKNVLVHNIAIIFGIAGVSSILGLSISPRAGVLLLTVLSFYDIVAVYWTHHMVHLARGMVESGAIFGFVIPFEFKDFLSSQGQAREKIGEKFMILGSGDIALPIIMASSLAVVSLRQSIITGMFSLGGLFLTHLIFINQSQRRPMAALPPIATMTIIGYLISSL